jgi:23S rRNA (uracil1939-C5)-methyltransferase
VPDPISGGTLDTLIVDIEGLDAAADGAGHASPGGRRVLVDYTLPGERVEVRVVATRGDTRIAEVVRIVRASPHRIAPACRHFGPCGGCAWQHIGYEEQLRLKQRMLQELLKQSLGARAPRVEMVAASSPWGFRHKVNFVFAPANRSGGLAMGHYRRRTQALVAVDECPVHAEAGNRLAFAFRDALVAARVDGATPDGQRGLARHLVARVTRARSETLATLVVTHNAKALRPAVRAIADGAEAPAGLHLNVHDRPGPFLFGRDTVRLHGRDRVRETVAGISFLISPTAFFQTNIAAAETMVQLVLDHAGHATNALDLYAGAGLFSLPLARRGARVTAVEENPQAVEDGEASRRLNRIADAQCRFVRARAEDVATGRRRVPGIETPDLVVVDPPRAGCPTGVLAWICRTLQPGRIVYVSCNPEALAIDLRTPLDAGYVVALVQPIDMFPHTAHLETVVVMEKRAKSVRPARRA